MIVPAAYNDIPELVKLINSAYRGEYSKKGWTTEAHLLDGELRTDQETLDQLMHSGSFLKYTEENKIQGCVYLQKQNEKLYLGMLSVSPNIQARGVGKKFLAESEKYAIEKNCSSIIMNVISIRYELISWYERHGYKQTGETKPFPADNKFGMSLTSLEFIVLEKNLS
jgi:ribosomal protein S18 acetylase RimI-like enzyme